MVIPRNHPFNNNTEHVLLSLIERVSGDCKLENAQVHFGNLPCANVAMASIEVFAQVVRITRRKEAEQAGNALSEAVRRASAIC